MKKINIHNICIGGGFLLLTLFTSCKSFLDGNTFLAELEKSMLYANAPYVDVTFTSKGTETATLIPAPGTYSDKYKATDTIQIQFEPQIGYFFTGWTVEPEDSVTFEDATKSRTTVNIVSAETPIVITANTGSRPDIVSASPIDEQGGVYRDRTIVVKFNQEMDQNSIYWTYSELKEKGIDSKNAFKVNSSKSDKDALYYAYWDGKNNSSIKYKNIEIKKYLDKSVNLLEYYGIPKFDEGNTQILRIPTKLENSAPPSVTDILVIIKKEVYCKINKTEVSLSKDYEWTYFTNGSTDKDPPKFMTDGDNEFSLWCTGVSGTNRFKLPGDQNTLSEITDKDTFQKNFSKDKKLYVKGCFEDSGSGPGSLSWKISKVYSKLYGGSSDVVKQGMVNFMLAGTTANFNGKKDGAEYQGTEIDLSSLEGEGLYKIDFIAKDNNDKESEPKSFYFFHDSVKPQVKNHIITAFGKNQLLIELSNPTMDYSYAEINVDTLSPQTIYKEAGFTTIPCKCDTIQNHSLKIVDYDIAGNPSEEKSYTVTITHKPACGMILYDSGRWAFSYVTKDAENKDIGTPIGIIWNTDDLTKCLVWGLDETNECIWGTNNRNNSFNFSQKTGYECYKHVLESQTQELSTSITAADEPHNECPSIWAYTKAKNDYAVANYKDLGITWFIPLRNEYEALFSAYGNIKTTVTNLNNNKDKIEIPKLKYTQNSDTKDYKNTFSASLKDYDKNVTGENRYYCANTGISRGEGIFGTIWFQNGQNYYDGAAYVRNRDWYHQIAHTMGQVDLSK